MKILIVTKNEDCLESEKIKKDFKELNISITSLQDLKLQHFKDKDLVITVGGDGTFLSASHYTDNQLILGVNSNKEKSEGALCPITISELPKKLKKIINKELNVKEYVREKVCITKKEKCIITEQALNETYIGNQNPHHPSNYILEYKDKTETQRSSGILITTGTGSTAWYKTMGGWPFSRIKQQLRFRVREPYTRRIHKSTILNGKIELGEKIKITSTMNHGLVAIDSIRTYPLELDDKIEISIGTPLRAIQ